MQTEDDGTFRVVNRMFCQWVGYTADELVGRRRFQDLLTMGGRLFHQTHWSPLLRMQGSLSEVKLEIQLRDGTAIPMVLNAIRRDQDGVMVHDLAAFVARDRDRYEQELLTSRKRLEALHEDARGRAVFAEQMIGIVSHDLRNPLSTIMMGSAVLSRGDLTPAQQRVVGQLRRATDRANRLIADLLDFTQARVGSGLAISIGPLDLHREVEDIVEELRLANPGRVIVHERSGAGECTADASRIAQLLGNLISNAIAYGTADQSIDVTTTIEAERFTVAVHNLGTPISAQAQASLFEPMTRGTKVGAQARSVGLGLFIVREIARAHGGTASVTSTREAGTTFLTTFPRNDVR